MAEYIKENYEEEARSDLEKIINEIDKNNNGKINLTEFLTFILDHEQLKNKK